MMDNQPPLDPRQVDYAVLRRDWRIANPPVTAADIEAALWTVEQEAKP